jgi:hypothetical protein
MASLQCVKPSNETCQQKYNERSAGQEVSKMTTLVVDQVFHHGSLTTSQTHPQPQSGQSCPAKETLSKTKTCCQSQAKTQQLDQGIAKVQTQCPGKSATLATKGGHHGKNHASNGTASKGKTKKKESKNLLQKIKDGISGNSSSSDSSSESDSDNDTRGKTKVSSVINHVFSLIFPRIS